MTDIHKKEESAKDVVGRIISAAKELGITKNKLADEVGCHVWTLNRWETGESEPLYCNVSKLKQALDKLRTN